MGRTAKGSGTLHKRTVTRNGKTYTFWEGQITIGTDTGSGKQQRKTFTGKTQKEVREKMQAAAVSVNEGSYFEPSKLTVKEWFDTWIDVYCKDKKFATIQQYKSFGKNHICGSLGAVKLSKLTSVQIQQFYNQLAEGGNKVTSKPLAPKSIKNIDGILKKCLNTAVEQGLIKSNPAQHTTIAKVIRKEVEPLTEEQQKAMIKAVKGTDYEYVLLTVLFTGLRQGEAIGLTWDCVDFTKGTLKVYRQLQKRPVNDGGYTFAPLKNSKTRVIKLSPFVIDILTKQKTQQKLDKLAAGGLWKGFQSLEEQETTLVFTDKHGEHLCADTLRKGFKKVAAEIGSPDSRFHDLRHTFAVDSLQNGDDFKTVQDALGHATAAFTLDIYGHVSERMKEEHAQRQQAFIEQLIAVNRG
ncbi:MAG: site-specific integrase [Oscillospiraceae bacterium]|nr:site-specific integrase [Oscillospiraceae bacterium]